MKIHSLCKSGFMRCTNGWYDISLPVCLELVTIAYWDCSNILHCNMQFPSPPSSANALLIELCVVHDCTLQFWICLCWINEAFLFPLSCSLEQKPWDVTLQGDSPQLGDGELEWHCWFLGSSISSEDHFQVWGLFRGLHFFCLLLSNAVGTLRLKEANVAPMQNIEIMEVSVRDHFWVQRSLFGLQPDFLFENKEIKVDYLMSLQWHSSKPTKQFCSMHSMTDLSYLLRNVLWNGQAPTHYLV